MNWLTQSIIATILLIPIWISIGFFERNFDIKSNVFIIWYFIGVIITTFLMTGTKNTFSHPSWIIFAIIFIGIILGGVSNMLLFNAVSSAPNPGLPLAINSFANIGVYVSALILFSFIPKYFNQVKLDLWSAVGIILTTIGIIIISIKK